MSLEISNQIILYKRRWAFLLGFFILELCAGISFASYGQINNFYVQFFKSTPAAVDWITNARNISAILITFPIALMIFTNKIGFKGLVLIIACSSTIGLLFVTLSFIDRSLFAVIVIGQTVSGIADTLGLAMPSTFAVLWFPESQVGTAIALNVLGLSTGNVIGYTLPSYLVTPSNHTLQVNKVLTQGALASGQRQLRYMYGSFLATSAAVTILFLIFLTDKPPTPPTVAQELKNRSEQVQKPIKEFFHQSKGLFTSRSYVLVCIVIGFILDTVFVENIMMSEVITDIRIANHVASSTLSGYIMSTYSVGAIIGLTLGGKVVDRCKRYKILALCGSTLELMSTVGVAVNAIYNVIPGLYACNALFGFFAGCTVVVLFEMVTQVTYPTDETLVNTVMAGIQSAVALLMAVLGRVMFQHWRTIAVFAFQSACVLMGILLLLLVSSRNHRLEVEDNNDTEETEQEAQQTLLVSQQ